VTKIRLTIYLFFFIIILFGLLVSIFALVKKNNPNKINNESVEVTPIPVIEISWTEAVNMVQSCQIKSVFQKRKLEVTLTDKNNQIYKTKEPKFNDIFIETNNLRSDCIDVIQTITE